MSLVKISFHRGFKASKSTKYQEKNNPWILSLPPFNFHFLFIHDNSERTFSLSNEQEKMPIIILMAEARLKNKKYYME